jgi:P-type Ca2+ transporter type 2C
MEKFKGLSEKEAKEKIKKYGLNVIEYKKTTSPFKIFISQFTSLFIIILILAALLSYTLGETLETMAILFIVIFNGILGFIQEYKASKAVEALQKMDVTTAKVIRDGIIKKIDSANIVPGDVIILEEGDKIPADAEIMDSKIWCNVAIITGESEPVEKKEKDEVMANTIVVKGRAVAKVLKTGKETEFGKIAELTIITKKDKTPLEKDLEEFSKKIAIIIFFIISVIFVFMLVRTGDIIEGLMFAVSLAISAIPEGLPIVVTVTLSLGILKLAKNNALVKRLLSVQSLGSVDVICTDKTGTLTKNELTIKMAWVDGNEYDITGTGYIGKGDVLYNGKKIVPPNNLLETIKTASLCTTAEIEHVEKPIGDPTELSILYAGMKMGLSKEVLERRYPLLSVFPFDSDLKRMSTVHNDNNKYLICVKGGLEIILNHSKEISYKGKIIKINEKIKKEIMESMEKNAKKSYRIIGVAMKSVELNGTEFDREEVEKDLTFLGFIGMYDAPNENVKESVKLCLESGIDVKMITGDHKITAMAIGKEIELIDGDEDENEVNITGEELDKIDDEELDKRVLKIKIFSRVSPEQKLRILKSIKRNGKRVAMTGDGVNDAPALKYADIGISMGINGTDVAKESSDVILLDDNFSTIVEAVKQGRTIFRNINKFIYYLVGSNFAEILVIINVLIVVVLELNSSANVIAMTVPLLPLQLLWINLVTDGFPAIALGNEPASKETMKKKIAEKILSKRRIIELIFMSAIISLPSIYIVLTQNNFETIRTMIFNYLVFVQMFYVLSIRTPNFIFGKELFSNPGLLGMICLSFVLQLIVINFEPLTSIMHVTPLTIDNWIVIAGSILITIGIFEGIKKFLKGKIEIFN